MYKKIIKNMKESSKFKAQGSKFSAFSLLLIFCFLSLLSGVAVAGESAPTITYSSTIKGGFSVPVHVAVDNKANIYVTDPRNQRVHKFNALGDLKLTIKEISIPLGVAVDGQGNIYVGDDSNDNVSIFDSTGKFLRKLGKGNGEFVMPNDIAIDSSTGRIYVTDSKANLVKVYNFEGTLAFTISDILFPTGIHIDSQKEELLIVDLINSQVKVFDLSGKFLRSFGSDGVGTGLLSSPQGLTVDKMGNIYVVDSYKGWVQVFDSDGNSISFVGSGDLWTPIDVVIDSYDRLIVTSSSDGKLVLYSISGSTLPSNWNDDSLLPDSDGDGMPDAWEEANGLNPNLDDASLDSDNDGLTNLQEYLAGTDPNNADTDGDGLKDGVDPSPGMANNNTPSANAGADMVSDPAIITLDGSGSRDPNSLSLTYNWTESGTNPAKVTFSDNGTITAVSPIFIAAKAGDYKFTLTVKNSYFESKPDDVLITIRNITPTAYAGIDQTVGVNTQVNLDGSWSTDANGDTLTYKWTQVSGYQVTLVGGGKSSASFTPQESGVYTFSLTVSDGVNTSAADEVNITVNGTNTVPVADAGDDQVVYLPITVTLDGSRSIDGNGDQIIYTWKLLSGPKDVTLSNATDKSPAWTPDTTGIYTFVLTVSDEKDTSLFDYVNITVNGSGHIVPVANAGADQKAVLYATVTLGGGMSYDEDNSPSSLTYKWTQVFGVTVSLSDSSSMTPTFVSIYEGVLRFQLTVSDGLYTSLSDEVEITVAGSNTPPVADAGEDQTGIVDTPVKLDGTGSMDEDGNKLTYQWTQTMGASVTLSDIYSKEPTFTPAQSGIYEFILVVKDNIAFSSDTVTITVNDKENTLPVADAGKDRIAEVNSTVLLDGGGSDANGDSLKYKWQFVSGPQTVTLSSSDSSNPAFMPETTGNYIFRLTVHDKKGKSKPDDVQISVVLTGAIVFNIKDGEDNLLTAADLSTYSWVDLLVPYGAISGSMDIAIAEDNNPPSPPEGIKMLKTVLDFAPDGAKFNSKLTVRIPYNQTKLAEAGIKDPVFLKVYTYNKETQMWDEITPTNINEDSQYIEFETDHFSIYGLGSPEKTGSYVDTGGANENIPPVIEPPANNSGGGSSSNWCFIATASYGSYLHPHVKLFREFRDRYLLPYSAGRYFVLTYYHYSPPVADIIAEHWTLKVLTRVILFPFLLMAAFFVKTTIIGKVLIILIFGIILSFHKRVEYGKQLIYRKGGYRR